MQQINDFFDGLARSIRQGDNTAVRHCADVYGELLRAAYLAQGLREDEAEERAERAVFRFLQKVVESDQPGHRIASVAIVEAFRGTMSPHTDPARAARVQANLLRVGLASPPGIELQVRYWPSHATGGDLYLAQSLAEGGHVIGAGDAVGHGGSAALYATFVLASIRARAGMDRTIGELLMAMSRLIKNVVREGDSLSLGLLQWRSETGEMRFANAGMPKPVIFGPNREELVDATGRPLGFAEELLADEVEIRLGNSDTLLIVSDGFEEEEDLRALVRGVHETGELPHEAPILPQRAASDRDDRLAIAVRKAATRGRGAGQ